MNKFILIGLALFCFTHIIRDYMQIEYGYGHNWFTSFGHVWHAPQYEVPGMIILFLLGCLFLSLAFHVPVRS